MTRSAVPDISALSLDDLRAETGGGAGAHAGARARAAGVGDDELERFRREWRAEVARKVPEKEKKDGKSEAAIKDEKEKEEKQPPADEPPGQAEPALVRITSVGSVGGGGSVKSLKSPKSPVAPLPALRSPTKRTVPLESSSLVSTSPTKIPFRAPQMRKDRDGAVSIYARAVEAEQAGKLNDALKLYRTAFKMDDNVDTLYTRQMARRAAAAAAEEEEMDVPGVEDVVDPSAPAVPEYDFRRHIQLQPDHERGERRSAGPSRLTLLLRHCPPDAEFAAAEEELPVPISSLPAELLEPILAHLDVGSIEAFAATCWRARLLTANAGAWRRIVQAIYRPPMVPPHISARELAHRHHGEWRTALVEEERVRLDGCYISVCHYVRPGAGEEWIAVTHMITYHRFLRFYPDGLVLSFLTTEHPSDVVPHLTPSLRGKGLHFGRWRLVRSDEPEEDEPLVVEEKGAKTGPKQNLSTSPTKTKKPPPRARIHITELVEPGMDEPKYEFEMHLGLRETTRGRWNKLDLAQYSTINLSTGEVLNLSLRHQKPFYFSKVRSWSPAL